MMLFAISTIQSAQTGNMTWFSNNAIMSGFHQIHTSFQTADCIQIIARIRFHESYIFSKFRKFHIWFSYFLLFLEEPAAEEVEDLDSLKNVDPDAETTLLFTKPTQVAGGSVELPAGKIVEFLVGFANKGLKDFVIDSIDASFRYPMDFTYHIQNFSAIAYQKTVKEGQEATVAYSFIPADAFAGRPIGLSINLAYRYVNKQLQFEFRNF